MKRTELARGATPLSRGQLRRTTGMPRTGRQPAESPVKLRKASGGSTDMPTASRDAVAARSGQRCEVAATDSCRAQSRRLDTPVGASVHHRRPRGMGGTRNPAIHDPANLLRICGDGVLGCHGHIERNRDEALANGWLVRSGADPATVPVLLWDYRWVLLGDGYTETEAP